MEEKAKPIDNPKAYWRTTLFNEVVGKDTVIIPPLVQEGLIDGMG